MSNAVVAVPGEEVKTVQLPEGRKALNELVGGALECILLGSGYMMYCNQDGNELELPVNPHFAKGLVRGPFVIIKTEQDGGLAGFSAQDIEWVMSKFIRSAPVAVLR